MRALVFLFFLWLLTPTASAQVGQPYSRHYTQVGGLPSDNVNEVLQDREGYIWVATGAGLCRFDGYVFKTWKAAQQPNVYGVESDKYGRKWAVSMTGQLYFSHADSLQPASFNRSLKAYQNKFGIPHDFYVAPSGDSIILSLAQLGIFVAQNQGTGQLLQPDSRPSILIVQAGKRMLALPFSRENNAQNTPPKTMRAEWHTAEGVWQTDLPLPNKLGPGPACVFSCSTPGNYLLAFAGRIYSIEKGRCTWFRDANKRINALLTDEKGGIYLCLHEGGGLRYYRDVESLKNGEYSLYAVGESVRHFFKDREDGWWISTHDRGIFYYPNPNAWFFSGIPGLEGSSVMAIAIKNNQTAYLGASKGQVVEWNRVSGESRLLPPLPFPTTVYDMVFDTLTNRLWVATNYLQCYENGKWIALPYPSDRGVPGQHLHLSKKAPLLYAASYKGIFAIDRQTFRLVDASQPALKAFRVATVAESSDGRVWAATPGGLQEWLGGGKFRKPHFQSPIFEKDIYRVALASSGLLMASNGEAAMWKDPAPPISLPMTQNEEASGINVLAESPRGQIWSGTMGGLLCWQRDTQAAKGFHFAHGVPPGSWYDLAFAGDTVLAAGSAGVLAFLPPLSTGTSPYFQEIQVNRHPFKLAQGHRLSYLENNLQFQLATYSYATGDRTQYRYRLGTRESWTETDDRALNFFSLGAGVYELEVQAKSADGIWSESLRQQWHIRPPFWRTIWFWGLLCGTAIGIVYLFFRVRLRQVRNESALLKQIEGLERAALQAQMNPHFIFNCLNSIQNFILKNDAEKATQYLSDFAMLVRDVLNASMNGAVSLEEEIRMIQIFLSLEKLRYKDRFDYCIVVDPSLDLFGIRIPPLLIQPSLENAVLHGMKEANGQGMIQVDLKEEEGQIVVTVTDNGPGMPINSPTESNNGHRSVSMGITRKRLSLLQRDGVSSMQINPQIDAKGVVGGTKVTLRIDMVN